MARVRYTAAEQDTPVDCTIVRKEDGQYLIVYNVGPQGYRHWVEEAELDFPEDNIA